MKIIADLEKKTLKILENERAIFRGEYVADKLILLMNKTLVDEYPSITGLLSNGRKIGPFSTDETYETETIGGITYTTASFTLSKENGFTLSEGTTQVTIWMNKTNGIKEALGNVTFNVINTTAFDDGDIIVSGDVGGAVLNMRTAIDNAVAQVNLNGLAVNELDVRKADKSEVPTKLSDLEIDLEIGGAGGSSKLYKHTYYIQWMDEKGYMSIITIYHDISKKPTLRNEEELFNSWLPRLRAKSFSSNHVEMYRMDNKQMVAVVNNYYDSDSFIVEDASRYPQAGNATNATDFLNRFYIMVHSLVEEV